MRCWFKQPSGFENAQGVQGGCMSGRTGTGGFGDVEGAAGPDLENGLGQACSCLDRDLVRGR